MRSLLRFSLPLLLLAAASTAQAVRITPAHSGSWYDPTYDKQGFTIEVLDKAGNGPERFVAVQWNTYDDEGNPAWAIGVGTTQRNVVTMTMMRAFGGARPPLQVEASEMEDWAEMTFTFDTCNRARADFVMLDSGEASHYDLRRLTQIGATTCTGGLGDEVPPDFEAVTIVKQFVPQPGFGNGHGLARLFLRPAYASFDIELRRIPQGVYDIRVGGVVEGTVEVVRVGGGPNGQGGQTMGDTVFRSPNEDGEDLLDFDPRGQRVEIVNAEGVVALSVELPAEPEDEDD